MALLRISLSLWWNAVETEGKGAKPVRTKIPGDRINVRERGKEDET